MFGKRDTEVLVVGAGPVGLFTALALRHRGIDVKVVDSQWRTAGRSYALALHPRSVELFAELGLADELVSEGHRVDTLAFYDGAERRAEVRFADLPGAHPFLLILPQEGLENRLESELRKQKVKVRWNHRLSSLELDGSRPTAHVDKLGKDSTGYSFQTTGWVIDRSFDIHTGFVVGADGHRSAVRRALGLEFETVADSELFAVFEFAAESELAHEARVVLGEGHASVLWPLGDGRYRWSFQVAQLEDEEQPRAKGRISVSIGDEPFPHLDASRLHRLLAERAPWWDAPITDVRWSLGIRFERRLVDRFGGGRAWLVGDAAHLAGPVGMRSMNVGLAEAWELVDRIDAVLHEGGSPELLDDWAAERQREWRGLLGLDALARVRPGIDPWVEREAERIFHCLPASGDDLSRLEHQVGFQIP